MHAIDLAIIAAYFLGVFALAIALRRRAARSIDSYFLGDRSLRWWLLGASGMASNVDMAGTMVAASILMVFGYAGFWIGVRGDIVLIMAFYMAFMGKWTRRSGKMTVAEWMHFRFGPGLPGDMPRVLTAIFNLVFLVWVVAYFGVATNKFFAAFLPTDMPEQFRLIGLTLRKVDIPLLLSAGLILITMAYTAISGLYGVVWTDVFQGALILFMSLYLGVLAFLNVDAGMVAQLTDESWRTLLPAWRITPPAGYEDYEFLGVAILFYFLKTIIDGMSGAGGYMAQRYFAAPSERDCAYLSLFWIFLMSFRWPLMLGIAVLGLTIRDQFADPELALPVVLHQLVPIGIKGLLIVALLAAAMSTYSAIINAGSSYFVKDLYQAYLRPGAGQRELVWMGYAASVFFVLLGLALAYFTTSINTVWDWLNMGLGAGVLLPNLLRWYWWRLSGYGYAAGAAAGMAVALCLKGWEASLPPWATTPYVTFTMTMLGAFLAIVATSLVAPPAPAGVLLEFYRTTRPFGAWGPVARQLTAEERASIRRENTRDILATFFAVPWQIVLFLIPMSIVIHQWTQTLSLAALFLVLSVGLYVTWFRHVPRDDPQHAACAGPADDGRHATPSATTGSVR